MPAATLPRRRPRAPSAVSRAWALSWICALACLLGAHPAPAEVPTLAFAQPTLQLDPRASIGQATLVLTATPAVTGGEIPKVEDAGGPGPFSVAVYFDAGKPQTGPKSTIWLVHAIATGVPPAITQPRLAHVTLGSQLEALVPYTLTNLSSTFKWTVQLPPATWSLAAGRDIPFAITIGPITATGVHLVSCGLVERSGRHLGCGHLQLCKAQPGRAPADCGQPLQLEAQAAHALLLRVAADFQDPGSYTGTVTVAANEIVDGALPQAIPMTVNSTTLARQALGVLVILLGLGAAFWVTAYRRNKMARDQALIPATLLGKKLVDLQAVSEKSPIPKRTWRPTATKHLINKSLTALKQTSLALNNYVPGTFPNPAVTVDAAGYQHLLQSTSDSIAILAAIVQEGFQVAWEHWASASHEDRLRIQGVLTNIDGLAAKRELPWAQVQSQIQAFLGQLPGAARSQVELLPASPLAQRQPPSLTAVNLDLNRLNLYGWAAWLVLTLIAGSAALILLNPAFGTLSDYVQCFLWSFGIAAAGQLTTLSFGSVSSALGIPLIKP